METLAPSVLQCGVAARALAGQSSCGDVHVVRTARDGALVAALDGVGHGSAAAAAAEAAAAILRAHPEEPVISLLSRCHEALRTTRGVVMSLASFDASHGLLTWLGVGNVQALLLRRGSKPAWSEESLLLRNGVVGARLPTSLRAEVLCVSPGDVLVFATDGVSSDFSRELVWSLPPQKAAESVLARHGKTTDDALVLVARYLPARAVAPA
jgi:serine phosphatase RsbU (regulator of sigma subunit)